MNLVSLVLEPPTFVREPSPANIVKGSIASIECGIAGTAPFEITWFKNTKEIKSSVKHTISQVNGTLTLEVQKCDSADIGDYQCTVSNEVGSATCKTTLKIKGWYFQAHQRFDFDPDLNYILTTFVHLPLVK